MSIREKMEQAEYTALRPEAAHAAESKGRPKQEEESDVRTCFQKFPYIVNFPHPGCRTQQRSIPLIDVTSVF